MKEIINNAIEIDPTRILLSTNAKTGVISPNIPHSVAYNLGKESKVYLENVW